MISLQRSGPPSTQNVSTGDGGCCVRLPSWSTSLTVKAQSPVRLYWNKTDFDADQNGLDISGNDHDDTLRLEASVCNLFIRGLSGDTEVQVTSIGIG